MPASQNARFAQICENFFMNIAAAASPGACRWLKKGEQIATAGLIDWSGAKQ
jgi:hypothetical protein